MPPNRRFDLPHDVLLIAGYPWWPISDPLLTFVRFCILNGLNCRIIGIDFLNFLKETYPPEPELESIPVDLVPRLEDLPARLGKVCAGTVGKCSLIFMDADSFTLCSEVVDAHDVLFYSSELPQEPLPADAPFKKAFCTLQPELIIQDETRLKLFEAYCVRPEKVLIVPNAVLDSYRYTHVPPRGLENLDWRKVLLLSGSLIPQHSVLEMADAFLRSDSDWHLLVNGWGELEGELCMMFRGRDNATLSTRYLAGSEMRWVYNRCRAGVVAYGNEVENHEYCGVASGKLFWLTRYGKPIVCNNNKSIANLVNGKNLGILAEESMDLHQLDDSLEAFAVSCRKFYLQHATFMERQLRMLFQCPEVLETCG